MALPGTGFQGTPSLGDSLSEPKIVEDMPGCGCLNVWGRLIEAVPRPSLISYVFQ